MNDLDSILRDALTDEAGHATPPPDAFAGIARTAHVRRRRRAFVGATALTAVVGALVLSVREPERQPVVTEPAQESSTTTSAPAPPLPGRVVAVAGTRLVVLDAATGEVQRVLYERDPWFDSDTLNGIAVGSDGTVWFSDGGSEAVPPSLYRVSADRGAPEVVAAGAAPAISPDGRRLAYTVYDGDDPVIEILDLATGETHRIQGANPEPQPGYVTALSWSPDGTHLAFELGVSLLGIGVVAADAESLDGVQLMGVAPEGTILWRDPQWTAQGLAVDHRCCMVPGTGEFDNRTVEVLIVDPDTGSRLSSRPVPPIVDFAFDASGQHLAYVVLGTDELVIELAGQEARSLGTDYQMVAWIP